MKEQRKQELWQSWLKDILSEDEYTVFYYYSHYTTMDEASPALAMPSAKRKQLFESSLKKCRHYMETYTAIVDQAKIHLYSKQQFLQASLTDLGLSTRTFHLLNGADLRNISDVLTLGINGLQRIRGFGDQSLIELKKMLKYKGCERLLE